MSMAGQASVTEGALLLIVAIGGERVVLHAAEVRSVVTIEALVPVPCAPAHVAGLTALRSRVLTAIDCRRALDLADRVVPPAETGTPAVVVEHEGHGYALVVDAVEDVVHAMSAPLPVGVPLQPGWQRVSPGMVETAQGPLLLVETTALIAGPATSRAAA